MTINYEQGCAIQIAKRYRDAGERVGIAHVVNNQGAWGKGFVLALSREWPPPTVRVFSLHESPEEIYREYAARKDGLHLGSMLVAGPEPGIRVFNMVAQTLGGRRPLHYGHLARCMIGVRFECSFWHRPIRLVCPKFGSGLAGGDWAIIEELIEGIWSDLPVTIAVL